MENSKASAGGPERFIDTAILLGLIALLCLEALVWLQVLREAFRGNALLVFIGLYQVCNLCAAVSFLFYKRTGDVACWIGLMLLVFGFLVVNTAAIACWLAKLN
jgi:hypothetical protein